MIVAEMRTRYIILRLREYSQQYKQLLLQSQFVFFSVAHSLRFRSLALPLPPTFGYPASPLSGCTRPQRNTSATALCGCCSANTRSPQEPTNSAPMSQKKPSPGSCRACPAVVEGAWAISHPWKSGGLPFYATYSQLMPLE